MDFNINLNETQASIEIANKIRDQRKSINEVNVKNINK
jgi:hypothetical protein